jgi:sulfonate transport system substrate-binding protein
MLKTIVKSTLFAGLTFGLISSAQAEELRIGYQKYGTLTVLKARGTLETRLKPLGWTVRWVEFPAGPQLLEGLNVGSIDFGTTGEAPPIFAQAAGANLIYVGNEPPAPASEAIVVPKGSTIKSVAELKGKKVVLNKGSNVHYLLVKALENAGLKYSDIQPVFLPPADARAAFERGSADAWVIWDPFLAAAEKQLGARILRDGKGLVANHQFFLATRPFAEKSPKVLAQLIDELDKTDDWASKNQAETVNQIAPLIGLTPDIVQLAVARYSYGVEPVSAKVATAQQQIADTFFELKLIPKPIQIKDALLAK